MRIALRTFCFITAIFVLHTISFPQSLQFRSYSEKDGLPATVVNCIYQDSKGFLWFGTINGLSRFDGFSFKNYKKEDGLPGNAINTIMEDRKGNLWIGTSRTGISCFSAGRFYNYTTGKGLQANSILAIAEDRDGILWFGTMAGLYRFDGSFTSYSVSDDPMSNVINDIVIDKYGIPWFASNHTISAFYKGRFVNYSIGEGLSKKRIFKLCYDSKRRLLVGTENGLYIFRKGIFTPVGGNHDLSSGRVTDIEEVHNGDIWIGTWNGIRIINGENFDDYHNENNLPHNFIFSVFQDREGNMWIASKGGLICHYSLNVVNYSKKDGLSNDAISAVIEDKKGQFWIGTGEGLNCFYNKTFKSYKVQDGLSSNTINGLLEDSKGKLWIATPTGLNVFSGNSFSNFTTEDGLPSNVIFKVIEGWDGTLWIGTRSGLCCFRNGKFCAPPFNIEPFVVLKMLEDSKGNLWFSSNAGLYRYSYAGKSLNCFTSSDGLADNYVFEIFEDSKGKIWIGTEGGLSSFENGHFVTYKRMDGLPDNSCYFIVEDNSDNLWIGTAKGLACFNGKSFRNFTSKCHGFSADSWYTGLRDSSDSLWFGSPRGLICFKPPLKVNKIPPPVHITCVKILEKDFPLSDVHLLGHKQNHLRVGYTGICFSAPGSIVYKYRFKGIDKEWRQTTDRSMFFPYLSPGKYTFQVKAVNNDGIESLKPAELAFEILPPFWKTWWFITLLVLFGVSLLLGYVQWRFKRAEEKLVLKTRTRQLMMSQRMELMGLLAASAVHDLKNLLAIIIGYSEIVGESSDSNDENYQYNENIKVTANTAVQVVKQILAFARQKQEASPDSDLTGLLSSILEILEITTPDEVKILWVPPSEEILFDINPTRLQQLVMNLCINAVHAMPEGGELRISLSMNKEKEILLEISDTGSGIKKESLDKIFDALYTTKEEGKGTGLGLFVVKQIVDEHNGKIAVHSEPGKGSTFSITFTCR